MKKITSVQLDALKELFNIGIGRAAGSLNELLDAHVDLTVPVVKVLNFGEIKQLETRLDDSKAMVKLLFSGTMEGVSALIFPTDSAVRLVKAMSGGKYWRNGEFDDLRIGTLTEVGNIVLNGVMGSISNVLEQRLNYHVPQFSMESTSNFLKKLWKEKKRDSVIIMASIHFHIKKHKIDGEILVILELDSFIVLLRGLDRLNQNK